MQQRLKSAVNRSPLLRKLLAPAIKLRRRILQRKQKRMFDMVSRFSAVLAEAPAISVPEFEGTFIVDPRSHLFQRIALYGSYEPELARGCLELLDKSRDAIDVGANVGFFSVLIARHLAEDRRVLSVEPTPNALRNLYRNLERNDVRHKAIVFEGVAAQAPGELTINTIAGKEEYSSIGPLVHPSVGSERSVSQKVSATTIDLLVEKFNLQPAFIKIDVEGSEHLVLAGARKTLSEFRPIILSELNDSLLRKNGSSKAQVLEELRSLNYKVVNPLDPTSDAASGEFENILCIPTPSASTD